VTTAVSIESDPTFSLVIRPSGVVALMLEAFCINVRSSDQAFFSSASCSTWEELHCEVRGPSRVDMNEAVKRSHLQKPNMLKKNKSNGFRACDLHYCKKNHHPLSTASPVVGNSYAEQELEARC